MGLSELPQGCSGIVTCEELGQGMNAVRVRCPAAPGACAGHTSAGSMDVGLSRLREAAKDRGAWRLQRVRCERVGTRKALGGAERPQWRQQAAGKA